MERYKQVFRQLPQPALLLDEHDRVDDFNAFAGMVFGLGGLGSRAENKTSLEHRVAPWLQEDLAGFKARGETTVTLEKEFEPETGSRRFFRVRLARAGASLREGTIVILTDITERRRALEEIGRLATIVDSSEDAIMSVSMEGVIQSANSGAEKIYGRVRDDLVGRSLFSLVPDALGDELRHILDKARAGRATTRYETLRRHSKGHLFPVSVTYSPIERHGRIASLSAISRDITERKQAENALRQSHQSISTLMHETVKALSMILEKRDLYTSGHQHRVSRLAVAMAERLGLGSEEIAAVRTAGLLHDIGKICIPMAILSRPARLSPGEMALVQDHPRTGLDILRNIPFPWPVGVIIHQHHERMDGSGYPNAIAGDDILPGARIVAVADVLEAMSSHRPYRPALGIKAAMEEFSTHRGSRYDSDVVDVMSELVARNEIAMHNGELTLCQ